MTKIIPLRVLAGIVSATAFAVALGYVLQIETVILSAVLVAVAVFASAQLTARLILDAQSDDRELLRSLATKVEELDAHGVRHMVVINSISDISNEEIRRLLEVQRGLHRG